MSTYEFVLTGISPILFHADDIEMNDELRAWRDDPANRPRFTPGDDRTPAWTWHTYLYSDGEYLAVPGENLMTGLRQAGAQVPMKGAKTFKSATQSGLLILDEFCEFRGPEGQIPMEAVAALQHLPFKEQADAVQEWGAKLFCKRAKVGQAKHLRVRLRFEDWTIRGKIKALNPAITDKVLDQFFAIYGSDVGCLDWRPSSPRSPGPYGRCAAKLKKVA
jgi:hypothetical protein